MCHKLHIMGGYSKMNPKPTNAAPVPTQVAPTTPKPVLTLPLVTQPVTLPPMCFDVAKNCQDFKDFCSQQEEVRNQCQLTCGFCQIPTIPEPVTSNTGPCPSPIQGMPGQYIPTCDLNMFYLPKQCNFSSRECWCTTPEGAEVQNTRSFFEDPSLLEVMVCDYENGQLVSNFKGDNIMYMDQNNLDPATAGELNIEKVSETSLTKCQEERADSLANKPGLFAPVCDDAGNYSKKQWYYTFTIL